MHKDSSLGVEGLSSKNFASYRRNIALGNTGFIAQKRVGSVGKRV
nr:hypothetical protein [Acetivibrio straminisolvens]